MRISTIRNGEEVHVDDVWVYGFRIPADGTFRRITYLSFKQITIVGVNIRVQCTNNATTADCSAQSSSTQTSATANNCSRVSTGSQSEVPHVIQGYRPAEGTAETSNCSQHEDAEEVNEDRGVGLPECIGVGVAAGISTAVLLTLITCIITCCAYKQATRKGTQSAEEREEETPLQEHLDLERFTMNEEPDQQLYEEIDCVHIQ